MFDCRLSRALSSSSFHTKKIHGFSVSMSSSNTPNMSPWRFSDIPSPSPAAHSSRVAFFLRCPVSSRRPRVQLGRPCPASCRFPRAPAAAAVRGSARRHSELSQLRKARDNTVQQEPFCWAVRNHACWVASFVKLSRTPSDC